MMQSSKVIFLNGKHAVPFRCSNTKQHALLCKKVFNCSKSKVTVLQTAFGGNDFEAWGLNAVYQAIAGL